MFRLQALRSLRRLPIRRCYSTNRPEPPKFRYLAAIAVFGTAAFVLSANSLDKKAPKKEITEEEYEQQKAANRVRYKKSAFTNLNVVFMIGDNGAGKTTQCKKLAEDGFVHISLDSYDKTTKYGQIAERFASENRPIPQDVMIALLHGSMLKAVKDGHKNFVIDGFPQTIPQVMKFEEDIAVSKLAVYLECPAAELVKRAANPAANFEGQTVPLINFLQTSDRVLTVQCNQSADKIHQQIKQSM